MALLLLACHGWAQTVPDAGALLQRIERDRLHPQTPQGAAQPPTPAPVMESLGGTTVTVNAFRFVGNRRLNAEQLALETAGFLHRPLTFLQLQEATVAVASAYRRAGWIVNVYLPQQDISDGVVTLQVVEAVFGSTVIERASSVRLDEAHVQKVVAAAQPAGENVNADAIDRALLLIGDLPGVTASGSLRAGQQDHQTDLVVNLTGKPLLSGEGGVDNTGSRATGAAVFGLSMNFNSPLHRGDLGRAQVLYAKGVRYARLGYSTPLGHDGWRAGVSLSALNYRVISTDFGVLGIQGTSSTAGLEAQYPWLRSATRNVYLTFNADHKSFDNQAVGATTSRYRIRAASLGLAFNYLSLLGLGGSGNANIALTRGYLDLGNSPSKATDATTTRSAGAYSRFRYNLSHQQSVVGNISLLTQLSGQSANKNLDSAEKFHLGGASGVRAYPASEAAGSTGHLFSIELQGRLSTRFTVSGFYDSGNVTVNRTNAFPGAAPLNRYGLKGAGITAAWTDASGLHLRATWARRIGDNPNPTASGNDQDGSLRKNRVWLVASHVF